MRLLLFVAFSFFFVPTILTSPNVNAKDFNSWLAIFKAEAIEKGIKKKTLDSAFSGVKPIPRVIELDRRQPEFTLTFQQYIGKVISNRRVNIGKRKLLEHSELLKNVSKKFNVQPRFIVALWAIETDFGRIMGGFPVISSLATLAFDGRRGKFFRKELILALKIIDDGHITANKMMGSWAGAMGQNQFMPSSFHAYAVDYNGDGSKDIWKTLPDVFASIANYLSQSGWRVSETWGRPVILPKNFAYTKKLRALAEWQKLGVKKLDGGDLPKSILKASIILPEKNNMAPAYLAYNNYRVILRWNRSDYFAIAVGTLADRLK
jgi:membrane-bound lytic murein transglycosylase B